MKFHYQTIPKNLTMPLFCKETNPFCVLLSHFLKSTDRALVSHDKQNAYMVDLHLNNRTVVWI